MSTQTSDDIFSWMRDAQTKQRDAKPPEPLPSAVPLDDAGTSAALHDLRRNDPQLGLPLELPPPVENPAPTEIIRADEWTEAELRGNAPPWHGQTKQQSGFYAPVPVTVVVQEETRRPQPDPFAAFGARGGRTEGMAFHLSLRPRAMLIGLAVICIGAIGWSVARDFRMPRAQANETATTLNQSLDLLTTQAAVKPATGAAPIAPQAVASTVAVATSASAAPPAPIGPTDADRYVQQNLPRLLGESTSVPPEVAARGLPVPGNVGRSLPAVPLAAGVGATSAAKGTALPDKLPVADRLSDPPPRHRHPTREAKHSPQKARPPHRVMVASAATSPGVPDVAPAAAASADGLSHVFIAAEHVKPAQPYRVARIAEQSDGLGAYVLPPEATHASAGSWVKVGHVFSNGWELVELGRTKAVFLSTNGRVAEVAVTALPEAR